MDDYELQAEPFYFNSESSVGLYRGRSIARNKQVVVKRHDFTLIQHKSTQVRMNQAINAALAQAKVNHLNSCEILEVQIKIESTSCSIYHVLEALDGDVAQDIKSRKGNNELYGEEELRRALWQTASALSHAHSKKIAHRDVKPSNIFKSRETYKLGDFGCFYMKRAKSVTQTSTGDLRYMSPQIRAAYLDENSYNPFMADVFALGASLLHMATLKKIKSLGSDKRSEEGRTEIERLPVSFQFKQLLKSMLEYEEDRRPSMDKVRMALQYPGGVPAAFQTLSEESPRDTCRCNYEAIIENQMHIYDWSTQTLTQDTLSANFGIGRSYAVLDAETLLCVGTSPASTDVCSLSLITKQTTSQPSLQTPRAWAGAITTNGFVYVFGGWDYPRSLTSCEKFHLIERAWQPLGSMRHARDGFTPCLNGNDILLVSCQAPIELFNLREETFTDLPFQLPVQLSGFSVSFVAEKELVVFTSDQQMARVKIAHESEFTVAPIDRQCWSNRTPLVLDGLVLIANEGKVEKFSLQTFSFI